MIESSAVEHLQISSASCLNVANVVNDVRAVSLQAASAARFVEQGLQAALRHGMQLLIAWAPDDR